MQDGERQLDAFEEEENVDEAEEEEENETTGEEKELPINEVMARVEGHLREMRKLLEEVQYSGAALYHERWPAISDQFTLLTETLLRSGMEINREAFPVYVELREKLNEFL